MRTVYQNNLKWDRTTQSVPANSTSLAIIDRRNNKVLAAVPFPDDQNPDLLPPPSTVVWHYIRFDYFKSMLGNRALWFSRLDKLSDKMDGRYSVANATDMTAPVKLLMEKFGVKEAEWEQLVQTNTVLRRKAFVHCWSMRPHELAWMWHTFLQESTRSIAIRSTIGGIHSSIRRHPVELKRVLYCPTQIPRPDYSYTAPFAAKDKQFENERELRLIITTPIGTDDGEDHILVDVNLSRFIGGVIVHPMCTEEFRIEVESELRAYSIEAPVGKSWIKRADLEALC